MGDARELHGVPPHHIVADWLKIRAANGAAMVRCVPPVPSGAWRVTVPRVSTRPVNMGSRVPTPKNLTLCLRLRPLRSSDLFDRSVREFAACPRHPVLIRRDGRRVAVAVVSEWWRSAVLLGKWEY